MSLEKKHLSPVSIKPIIFPIAGLFFGLLIWLIDAMVDVLILEEEQGIIENILMPDESTELWMRTLVVIVFVVMGFFSQHVLKKHIELDRALLDYQKRLEEIVYERTQDLVAKAQLLEVQANTDPLTSLFNRRKFSEVLELELSRFQRYKQAFCLINIDIDFFKQVNDTYGHNVGDKVIQQFSEIIQSSIRRSDSAARWGGEEFLLMIIESDIQGTLKVAENLSKAFNETHFDTVGKVTASIGITEVSPGDNHEDIIRRSDQALYKAKDNGRNRIENIQAD